MYAFEKYKAVKLTPEQLMHYRTVKWLIGGGRRTGRTYVMALAYIEKSLCDPDGYVTISDHSTLEYGFTNYKDILKQMNEITSEMGLTLHFRKLNNSIQIKVFKGVEIDGNN